MAKTTKKTKAPAAGDSPCRRGAELGRPGGLLRVTEGTTLTFGCHYCQTAGNLFAEYREASESLAAPAPLINQDVPPPEPVEERFPAGGRGLYVLTWDFVPYNDEWEVTFEVLAGEVLKFRQYKNNESQRPNPKGYLLVEVM